MLKATLVRDSEEGPVFRISGRTKDGIEVDREIIVGDGCDGICWVGDDPDPIDPFDNPKAWDEVISLI